jgi:hypothetical protein
MKNTLISGSFSVQASNAVNMGANIVQNAGTPVNPTDLATKAYVDLNAGTQNLQSVLTAGNTTGNFNIEYADTYGCVFNGTSTEKWVMGVDPNSFTSTASNDFYVAGNALDNYMRIGNATGGTFSEVMKVGINGASAKAVAITGTLSATSITDSASSVGTSGQVLTCGGGGTLTWGSGGGGVAGTLDQTLALGNTATGAYANITLTDTAVGNIANPIMKLENTNATGSVALECFKNKPTASVNGDVIFTQSCYGKDAGNNKQEYTRINHSVRDNSSGVEDGSIEFGCYVNGSVNTFIQINGNENEVNILRNLDMTGNNITTNTGSLTITTASSTGTGSITATAKAGITLTASNGSVNTTATTGIASSTTTGDITSTCVNGTCSIASTAGNVSCSAGNVLNLTASSAGGIKTNQLTAQRTILRTGYTNALSQNLDYYPSYVITNTGITTNLTLPYLPYQNLTLVNEGVNATYNWTDVGDVVGTSPTTFYRASSGLVWVGVDNQLKIYADLLFSNPPLFVYTLSGGATIECFHEAQGFMFVGGNFAGIVGQPQNQFNLMRFAGAGTSTPAFDPVFSASGQEGFNGQIYAITSDNTNVYVGGNFTTTFPPAFTLSNLCIVGNPYGSSGTQTYTDDTGQFSTNNIVYAMYSYNNSGVQNIYVGGNFTNVAGGFQTIAYGAVYEVNWTTTPFSTLGIGNFNSLILGFAPAVDGTHLLITGAFSFTEGSDLIQYGGYSTLANTLTPIKPFNITGLGASGLARNCINRPNGLTPAVNFFITDNRQVWFGTDINAWEDGGVAFGSGTPAGIIWNGTNPYVLMPSSTTGVRIGVASTANATFILPSEAFRTATGTFAKAILPEYTSQQFVANSTGTLYIPVGTPISTFSN